LGDKSVQTDETAGAPTVPAETIPGRLKDKLAIVGFADGHRDLAPFDDPDYEIWGLNRLHVVLPGKRFDRWFELHPMSMYAEDEQHQKFLAGFAGDVFVRGDDYGRYPIPNQRLFPKGILLEEFPSYFTNTISWLVALATVMEYETVAVFGVDMAQDSELGNAEYQWQRPSCEFFLGVLAGRGVNVELPEGSDLLKSSHLYGFDDNKGWRGWQLARHGELGKRKQTHYEEIGKVDAEIHRLEGVKRQHEQAVQQLAGAQAEVQYLLKNFTPNRAEGEG